MPFCNLPAESNIDPATRSNYITCNNCGIFLIDRRVLNNISKSDREKIAVLLRRRMFSNQDIFHLTPQYTGTGADGEARLSIDELVRDFPVNVADMTNWALLNLSRLAPKPGSTYELSTTDYTTPCATDNDSFIWIYKYLLERGWISTTLSTPHMVCLNAAGWEQIERIKLVPTKSRQAFVAMWFSEEMNTYWENAIKPAIETGGRFDAKRIDGVQHNNKICDEIIAEIRKSKFVVADFTGNRGGVYYEAGFAHALGLPVIFTIRNDHLKDIHFDTRQYNHIIYENAEELKSLLGNRIQATIA